MASTGKDHNRVAAGDSQASEIAKDAKFSSFGTNDLTQTTVGISRDDATSFLGSYTAKGSLPAASFVPLNRVKIGEFVSLAGERGRAARPGIFREHTGDPAPIVPRQSR